MLSTPAFLSVTETCQRLSISRSFFYLLAKRGNLRAVKLGRRTLVPLSELERLVPGTPDVRPVQVDISDAPRPTKSAISTA